MPRSANVTVRNVHAQPLVVGLTRCAVASDKTAFDLSAHNNRMVMASSIHELMLSFILKGYKV